MVIAINSEEVLSPPAPSATIMLLRDSAAGLQVLMMRRHGDSGVLGGVHVFPGGKLDAADSALDASLLDLPADRLHAQLMEPDTSEAVACALHVAALRETFEECRLLLAHGLTPQALQQAHAARTEGMGFHAMLQACCVRLQASAIVPWARWITPRTPSVTNRRFDTRFFVAQAPAGQEALHDSHEATETVWLTPADGLRRYWDGQIDLAPPQIMCLSQLARLSSVADALQRARSQRPAEVNPEPLQLDGTRVITYPGDPQHSNPVAVWDGPTRLAYRNRRFEPEGGLAALLP